MVNLENREASANTPLIPSSRILNAGLPLVAGSALISIAISNIAFSEGAFIMEWIGTFLAFYGFSTLTGTRIAISLSGVILVAGIIGDIVFLGGMTPVDVILANYMVFIHAALGSLTGKMVAKMQS